MTSPLGLYDRLVYADERDQIHTLVEQHRAWVETPTDDERRVHLTHELVQLMQAVLVQIMNQHHDNVEKVRAAFTLIDNLLNHLGKSFKLEDLRLPVDPLQVLKAMHEPGLRPQHPPTGLRQARLFTAAAGEPNLLPELTAELASANQIDILVSFITWGGVRKILDVLQQATAVDASGVPRTTIRILTTTYMGATEARAVNELAGLPGVQLKISLDGRRNRLHAKAWIFRRDTGFGSAYVGSANLSKAAMVGGIEWTTKVTEVKDREVYASACNNFEALWHDQEFQRYDPHNQTMRSALIDALQAEKQHSNNTPLAVHTWFELKPKAYQAEILEALAAERTHGRRRNLLVAATGTGKTVVAAFDYARLAQQHGGRPRLLFVAHQAHILIQALATFRQVLRDPSFGALFDGTNHPHSHDHLFATISILHSRKLVEQLGVGYWHHVIIDEAHHLPANTFDQFAANIAPYTLLGLTATPDRTDGRPINKYFDPRPDGAPAYSLRLWDALDQQLLAPFEYYGIADETDLTSVLWNRGEEAQQLDAIIGSNVTRCRLVIDALLRYVTEPNQMKALAFCVSVRHAEFMAQNFNQAGLAAICLSAKDNQQVRQTAVAALRNGDLKIICVCDLFNEGIDIPEINTLLQLRPTQSPIVFEQQIGRGLRLSDNKDSCLVLDFVGQYSRQYRFDILLRTMTGLTRGAIRHALEHGFGMLPTGCHIQFDKVSKQRVLNSLGRAANLSAVWLRTELSAWLTSHPNQIPTLAQFLHDTHIDLADLYSNGRSWTWLKRQLNLPLAAAADGEEDIAKRIGSLIHVNDATMIAAWRTALQNGHVDETRVSMLVYQMLPKSKLSPRAFLALMNDHVAIKMELLEFFTLLDERSMFDSVSLIAAPKTWPLRLHARYETREIQAAIGHANAERPLPMTSGVLPLGDEQIEVLFVTLDKSEGFGERVQFNDYALTPELFHWQTQNRASTINKSGRRYIESMTNGWRFQLFVRENRESAFVAMGPVQLQRHSGSTPISIEWRLEQPMPISLFRRFALLRDAIAA